MKQKRNGRCSEVGIKKFLDWGLATQSGKTKGEKRLVEKRGNQTAFVQKLVCGA